MKKTKDFLVKKIKVPLYKTEVWFCVTAIEDQAKSWFKKVGVDIKNWPEAEAHTWLKPGQFPVVFLRGIKSSDHIANMCHEVTHAAWFALEEMGVKLSEDNHEALTYLQSFIIRELYKK